MAQEIMHVGLTVTDLDKSISFYRDVLGLDFIGEIRMEGKETDLLFGKEGSSCRVGYLKGTDDVKAQSLELICFDDQSRVERNEMDLFRTSISEICFYSSDIDKVYEILKCLGVPCISAPQPFDFSVSGFGRSKAIYLRDPDGIIVELMEPVKD